MVSYRGKRSGFHRGSMWDTKKQSLRHEATINQKHFMNWKHKIRQLSHSRREMAGYEHEVAFTILDKAIMIQTNSMTITSRFLRPPG